MTRINPAIYILARDRAGNESKYVSTMRDRIRDETALEATDHVILGHELVNRERLVEDIQRAREGLRRAALRPPPDPNEKETDDAEN